MSPVTRYGRKMAKRTDKLTDSILRRIEELRLKHGTPDRPMRQKTLARRSGQTYARVHKFLSGQMPYPPMDFLDALLRSFGTTLADELKGSSAPPKQRPIVRTDVQEVADLLDDADAETVSHVKGLASLLSRATTATVEVTDRNGRAPVPAKPKGAGAARRKRVVRRPD